MVLPSVVDISMLYGYADAASIGQWSLQNLQQMLPIGQIDGVTDADALLAYALGLRLRSSQGDFMEIRPIVVSLPAGPQTMTEPASKSYGQLVQVPFLQEWDVVPYGMPLAVTFTLTGDMYALRPHAVPCWWLRHAHLQQICSSS